MHTHPQAQIQRRNPQEFSDVLRNVIISVKTEDRQDLIVDDKGNVVKK